MRSFNLLMLCLTIGTLSLRAQEKSMLMKSWIKQREVALKNNAFVGGTGYFRYTFDQDFCIVSFAPAWNDRTMDWTLDGDKLKIGMVTYHLDTLTDSTLVLSERGVRQILFKNEQYLSRDTSGLVRKGDWNGEPLYAPTLYITPRYNPGKLDLVMRSALIKYMPSKAGTFLVNFIIGKDGSVNNIQLVGGIENNVDQAMIKTLQETSGEWSPATTNGQPLQIQTRFKLAYLGVN